MQDEQDAPALTEEEEIPGLLHVRLNLEDEPIRLEEHEATTRDRAFQEGCGPLEGRMSLADLLTDVQRERISRDDPFEVPDLSHPAMSGDHDPHQQEDAVAPR
jgi:hypothetical protein